MAQRVQVRTITSDEGNKLLRIVRRSSGSVVTWRRAQMAAVRPGQVDDDRDVPVALSAVPPDVLVDADHLDPVKASLVVDEDPAAFGEDRIVGGVPRDSQSLSNTGDSQVLTDDRGQRAAQPTARELRAGLGRESAVLPADVYTVRAPVAADRQAQRRRPPPERLVRENPGDGVTQRALAAATSAPNGRAPGSGRRAPRGRARVSARSPRNRARRAGRT